MSKPGRAARWCLTLSCIVLGAAFSAWDPPGPMHRGGTAGGLGDGCLTSGCHTNLAEQEGHLPERKCGACHKLVDEKQHRFSMTSPEPALCTGCHEDVDISKMTFIHGPVATGKCTLCHDPHGGGKEGMLTTETNDLCLSCHEDMQARMKSSENVHQAAADSCVNCHDPHGAENRMNLSSKPPELCLQCHDEIGDLIKSKVTHGAIVQGRACVSCHEAHASPHDALLADEEMALCLSCHDRPLKKGKTVLTNMKALLDANPEHHGPIAQGSCTDCHDAVHGGDHFRLLMADYPATFYTRFDEKAYALCFQCHEPDLVRDPRTTSLTGFRNGDRNLHYLHVNRKKKGRTCRACHETHASKQPFHIREAVPFGSRGWSLPLGYKKTPSGGSCSPGCHKTYSYDRENPVVNIKPAGRTGQ